MGNIPSSTSENDIKVPAPPPQKQQTTQPKSAKILMLGPGSCGKSSIYKQAKLVFGKRPDDDQLRQHKVTIYANIISTISHISQYCIKHNIPFESQENEDAAKKIIRIEELEPSLLLNANSYYTPEIANYCKKLWNDKNVKKHFTEAYRFWHIDDGVFQYVLKMFVDFVVNLKTLIVSIQVITNQQLWIYWLVKERLLEF